MTPAEKAEHDARNEKFRAMRIACIRQMKEWESDGRNLGLPTNATWVGVSAVMPPVDDEEGFVVCEIMC